MNLLPLLRVMNVRLTASVTFFAVAKFPFLIEILVPGTGKVLVERGGLALFGFLGIMGFGLGILSAIFQGFFGGKLTKEAQETFLWALLFTQILLLMVPIMDLPAIV